jgi:hypothetical protein
MDIGRIYRRPVPLVDAAGAPRAPDQAKMGVAADKISRSSVVQPKLCCSLCRRGLDDVRWSNPGWHVPIAGADREILDRLTADPPLQQTDLPFHRSVPDATSKFAQATLQPATRRCPISF